MPRPHTPVNTPTVTAEGDWLAPRAEHPVDATVTLPGSKSLTNRYLVLAALADGTSRLRRPLRSRDTLLMAQALRSLGAGVEDLPGDDPEAPTGWSPRRPCAATARSTAGWPAR